MPTFLVVASNGELVNKFKQASMLEAVNLRDYLEGLGEYKGVEVFQHTPSGSLTDWVKVDALDS